MKTIRLGTVIALALGTAISPALMAAPGQMPEANAPAAKPPTVLYMCPHGAAKSVLASAYFVRVDSAGTEPDRAVSLAVAAHLTRQGYAVPIAKPRKATAEDVAAADVVISIGCDLSSLPAPRGRLERWDEVPAPSENFAAADEAIRKRVVALVEELLAVKPSKK